MCKKERKTKMNIQIKILDFFKKMKTEVLQTFKSQTENIYKNLKYICPLTQKFYFLAINLIETEVLFHKDIMYSNLL